MRHSAPKHCPLLIIKENIFPDVNTGSNLGGRAQEGQGDRKKLYLYPIPSRLYPVAARIFCRRRAFFFLVLADIGSLCAIGKTLHNKFYFFPKYLIFPAKSSLTF